MTLKSVNQRMPISLLELNTFGHAVLAVLIYILWWEKPFDVETPSIVGSRLLSKRRALDLMQHPSDMAIQAAKQIKLRLEGSKEFQADRKESQPSTRLAYLPSLDSPMSAGVFFSLHMHRLCLIPVSVPLNKQQSLLEIFSVNWTLN